MPEEGGNALRCFPANAPGTMTSTLWRWPLLRFGVAGWLLVGMSGCTGEEVGQSALTEHEQGDTGVPTREAAVESDRALAEREAAAAQAARLAVESDRALAEQGDVGAQARLGKAHYLGLGATQDFQEALRWARPAADQGSALGQGVLAAAYNTGNGIAQDYEEALRWARLAADQGDASGRAVVASLYYDGLGGLQQDYEEAARLYRLGAEQGHPGSQIFLGTMYLFGHGVERDFVEAYMWTSLGASGPGVSAGALDVLTRFMTPEQIAEAEARARDWRK